MREGIDENIALQGPLQMEPSLLTDGYKYV